jgi:hypothetical protein
MKVSKLTALAALCAGSLCFHSPNASAQDDGPPPPPPPGAPAATPSVSGPPPNPAALAPGGGGGADRMEQFRQHMNERIKTALKASDEEWAVIQPLLNNVQDKMRETMLGRFGGGPRPERGPRENAQNGGGGDRPERAERPNRPDRPASATSAPVEALRTALESTDTSNTEIKAKLEAVRQSRQKAVDDLAKARTELKSVLSLRQEATLVMMGMLD